VTAALCVSGLPTDRFQFVGFPPAKRAARRAWLQPLSQLPHTLVIYESPHRIVDSLADMSRGFGGERHMTLARELTKHFETLIHGPISEVLSTVLKDANQQRGEFVLVIAGLVNSGLDSESASLSVDLDKTLSVLLQHLPVKTAARCAAEICSINRKQAYDRALKLQGR
jgi:16S rRNA (cytidine1402-2'-O)-methyltransferase